MKTITTHEFKTMLVNGTSEIAKQYEYINELNVFPVPDGDTGTNMKITTTNAIKEVYDFVNEDISLLGRIFSRALLMNARGNSGVIFSQIIKGFISGFKEGQKVLTTNDLIESFVGAKTAAYSAVSNPVEGTILTVIRVVSERLVENKDKFSDVIELFEFAVCEAKIALDNTPNLLEELKKVGVVDSGGYGLWCFLVGMHHALICPTCDESTEVDSSVTDENSNPSKLSLEFDDNDYEEGFGYCSEIILKVGAKINPSDKTKKPLDLEKFKADLLKIGDSLVCVQDEDIVKIHVHTFEPGKFLNIAQPYGEFIKLKFENMTEQYYARIEKEGVKIIDTKKPSTDAIQLSDEQVIVVTCPSPKIKKLLKDEYGITHILDTANIGNPSIKDILLLVQKAKSNKVFIVTDDSNIVLAANQAAEIVKDTVDARVIKGNNVFEALVACLEFNPSVSIDSNERQMKNAVSLSTSAMISTAIKDVEYSQVHIKNGDYISIINKKIECADKDPLMTLKLTIDLLMKKAHSPDILLILYSDKKDLKVLKDLKTYVVKKYNLICEFKNGGQKVYNYFVGLQ